MTNRKMACRRNIEDMTREERERYMDRRDRAIRAAKTRKLVAAIRAREDAPGAVPVAQDEPVEDDSMKWSMDTLTTCAHLDCPNAPTHQQPVQTALMQQPVYYLVCAEHADGLLDPDDPYSYADVTIGQTQHTEG